jgi:hypothetical protein
MKRIFVFAVSIFFGAGSFANSFNHFAEGQMVTEQGANLPVSFTDRKEFGVSMLYWNALVNNDSPGSFVPDAKNVHARALSDFQTRFSDVTKVQWFSNAEGFTSYFMKNGFNDRAFYNKHGRWLFSMIYETENSLPKDIRAAVKSVYYDWKINVVIEVHSTEGQGYVVYLEDQTSFRVLKVNSDKEMAIMLDLDKQ